MVTPFIPTPHTVEMYLPGEPVEDRFGNLRPGPGAWESVRVASWWVHKTEEKGDDSILRTVDLLTLHVPVGFGPVPGGRVRLPNGTEWEVAGNPEDFNHGWHGWAPGLLVVHAKRVEG